MSAVESTSPASAFLKLAEELGDSPEFRAIIAELLRGRAATIDGAWKSSAALACASLSRYTPKTLLVVIAHPLEVDAWESDLQTFTGERPGYLAAWDAWPPADAVFDEIAAQRLRLLRALKQGQARIILATIQGLLQPVPSPSGIGELTRTVRRGLTLDPDRLAAWLVDHGYQNVDTVELPGEFSRRGGILDVFSPDADHPVRIDFFGDEIDEIRGFSVETQRSLESVDEFNLASARTLSCEHFLASSPSNDGHLVGHFTDWLPQGTWVALHEPHELEEQARLFLERVTHLEGLYNYKTTYEHLTQHPSILISALPVTSSEATLDLRSESVERFSGDVNRVRCELDEVAGKDRVLIACHNEGSRSRLEEIFSESTLLREGRLELALGRVHGGFRLPMRRWVVIGDHELFLRDDFRMVLPRRRLESRAIDSFVDLREGDLVVHVVHGIARYRGLQVLDWKGRKEEHLALEFRGGTRVYVPASKIDLVQKYIGGGKSEPPLSKVGGTGWQRKKDKVAKAVVDLASEMLQLQALREAQPGLAYNADSDWQLEFEAAFPYEETPDQLTSLREIKKDMESSRPMDRLLCGDVGYGKTELAIRAAFKAVDNGKQVAVLVPTTVLAEQHYRTFTSRFAEYPIRVAVLSRFHKGKEQKQVLEEVAAGTVDIVIGTHRLLSRDVHFHDLGLVIIDEEQRFGVEHKERLKHLRATVDVLTMTATPIPRTLHLSLLGIRDISNLETPPRDRLAIETRVVRFDDGLIRQAILRELNREGQVFFVHNRVQSIQAVANRLQQIVPEARYVVGHGQMPERELERTMLDFVNRKADVLVATTIIESGLDIPNANTIFINNADQFGLAELHQLRGRVGRYKHRAYCYLLVDPDRVITGDAVKRLKAIEEYTELGAGFKIALRDLEIRGAGNILGTQQSGHIAAVGYEMYCQLLENAVRQLKKMPQRTPLDVHVDLPFPTLLPREYIPSQRLRIEVYRRLARIRTLRGLNDFREELIDRFGPPPETVVWLLRMAELRLNANKWRISRIRLEGPGRERMLEGNQWLADITDLVLEYRSAQAMKKLTERSRGRLRVVDGRSAYIRLYPSEMHIYRMYELLVHLFGSKPLLPHEESSGP